ncbi:MAG: hypothetical protein R2867_21440 [Caldilineaceae bacterium]
MTSRSTGRCRQVRSRVTFAAAVLMGATLVGLLLLRLGLRPRPQPHTTRAASPTHARPVGHATRGYLHRDDQPSTVAVRVATRMWVRRAAC